MRKVIAICIHEVLDEGKSLYFGGLGKLKKRKSKNSIKFKADKGKSGQNKYLIDKIARKSEVKSNKAYKAFSNYLQRLKKSLKKDGIAAIYNVGAFSRKKKKIVFHSFFTSNNALTKKKAKKRNSKKDKKSKVEQQALISSEVSVLDEVIVEQQELAEVANLQTQLTEDENFKTALKDHFYKEEPHEIENSSPVTPLEVQHQQIPSKRKITNYSAILLLSLIGIFTVLGLYNLINKKAPKDQDVEDVQELGYEMSGDEVVHPEETLLLLEDEKETSNEILTIEDTDNKCIIVTGSFSDKVNQRRMENTIRNQGYELWVEDYGKLKRIGLVASCDESDLQKELEIVRNNIEESAWVLSTYDRVL